MHRYAAEKCYINQNYLGDGGNFYYVFVTISYFRERIHPLVFDAWEMVYFFATTYVPMGSEKPDL